MPPKTAVFPQMFRVRQRFARTPPLVIPEKIAEEFSRQSFGETVLAGSSVAIAVGSRGIANLAEIVAAVVRQCLAVDARPFIIPAMGSHGGASAEGQAALLARYGVDEANMGCPIRSQMDTIVIGESALGLPVHLDAVALQADHVLLINRIKPHTRFVGPVESGLTKMLLIGLGKHAGATIYHQAIQTLSFPEIVESVSTTVLEKCPVRFGLAVVENAFDETAHLELVPAHEFKTREPELLKQAAEWLPRLPFAHADLLIVDQIGKDISGAGMDTNVVGRKYNDHVAAPQETPKIHQIFARSLSKGTKGNATGIGIAEFCRTEVVEQMDKEVTWINCLTGGHATAGMIPLHWPTDQQILSAAIGQCGLKAPAQAHWLWIHDTLHLEELLCSESYWQAATSHSLLEVLTDPAPFDFDAAGQLREAFA
jgi:hypothetical protein